jgi:hypothetical protein
MQSVEKGIKKPNPEGFNKELLQEHELPMKKNICYNSTLSGLQGTAFCSYCISCGVINIESRRDL